MLIDLIAMLRLRLVALERILPTGLHHQLVYTSKPDDGGSVDPIIELSHLLIHSIERDSLGRSKYPSKEPTPDAHKTLKTLSIHHGLL